MKVSRLGLFVAAGFAAVASSVRLSSLDMLPSSPDFEQDIGVEKSRVLGYKMIKKFPHDSKAFTQGLLVHDGAMFESTGLYGQSTIRKVDVETGKVLQMSKFSDSVFGEGMAMHNGKLYALSWKERLGFRIDPNTLTVEQEYKLPAEVQQGWGLASDGTNLLATDSTQRLHTLDDNFNYMKSVTVKDPAQNDHDVPMANELEFMDGKLWANIYGLDHIAVIEPTTGNVERWIDCRGLWPGGYRSGNAVFNGIAYDQEHDKLYVTGKNWPALYQIEVVGQDFDPAALGLRSGSKGISNANHLAPQK